VINQAGSARSSDAAAGALRAVLPRVQAYFRNALVRGDTDFDRADVYQEIIDQQAYFAIGGRVYPNRAALVQALPERAWQPFIPRAQRRRSRKPVRQERTPNWRQHQAAQRGYRNLRTTGQWITELPYRPTRVSCPCRMIVRRIRIEEQDGQGALFECFRYRLILTNLPRSYTPREIVDLAYQRCDQENVIEQFGAGIAGWRMPVAEFMGNWAWLQIARLAWNLGKWIAQLALPAEVVRWEWKRFRRHFVYIAAKVLKKGRRLIVQLTDSHRYLPEILTAHTRLQV
jgi:hypothetical protein